MPGTPRFAVIVSRFPKLTETFILQELRGLEARGLNFDLFAVTHEAAEQLQPEARDLDARANYFAVISWEVLAAQVHWLRHAPRRYLRAWFRALTLTHRSAETLVRTPATVLLAATMGRRMQAQGIERLHAHWATYPTLAASVIRQLTDLPYSFTAHAHDIFVDFGGLDAKVQEADLVLTCTEYGRDVIIERAGKPSAVKVILVHHGVDLDLFCQTPLPQRRGIRQLRVLCVASMQDYKGHRHLLDAARLLVDDGVDLTLELIGDGELRPDIERRIRELRLGPHIELSGRQTSAAVRHALRRCDVFALASVQLPNGRMDGIPNVLVEALATGRPVVASSLPAIKELIIDNETGLLTTPGDPHSIAKALTNLADDPQLAQRLVRAGRAKVNAEHDARRCTDDVYRHLSTLPIRSG